MNTASDLETLSKTCTVCGKTYPATAEYFGRTKNTKSGLVAYCKDCANHRQKEWHRRNPGKRAEYNRAARETHPERSRIYQRAYQERKKAKVDRLLAEKDARIAELEAMLRGVLP